MNSYQIDEERVIELELGSGLSQESIDEILEMIGHWADMICLDSERMYDLFGQYGNILFKDIINFRGKEDFEKVVFHGVTDEDQLKDTRAIDLFSYYSVPKISKNQIDEFIKKIDFTIPRYICFARNDEKVFKKKYYEVNKIKSNQKARLNKLSKYLLINEQIRPEELLYSLNVGQLKKVLATKGINQSGNKDKLVDAALEANVQSIEAMEFLKDGIYFKLDERIYPKHCLDIMDDVIDLLSKMLDYISEAVTYLDEVEDEDEVPEVPRDAKSTSHWAGLARIIFSDAEELNADSPYWEKISDLGDEHYFVKSEEQIIVIGEDEHLIDNVISKLGKNVIKGTGKLPDLDINLVVIDANDK